MKKDLLTVMMYGFFGNFTPQEPYDPLQGVDIEKEYELIKQKKSKLSANNRRLVVLEHERYLKRLKEKRGVNL